MSSQSPACTRCSQANPEEQRQDAAGQVRGRWKEAEPEASGQEEPDSREGADKRTLEAKVRPWSFHVHALPALRLGVLPLFIRSVSSYRKGSQSPYSWVTSWKKRQELFTLVTEVRGEACQAQSCRGHAGWARPHLSCLSAQPVLLAGAGAP